MIQLKNTETICKGQENCKDMNPKNVKQPLFTTLEFYDITINLPNVRNI